MSDIKPEWVEAAQIDEAFWSAQEAGDLPRPRGGYVRETFEIGYRAALAAVVPLIQAEHEAEVERLRHEAKTFDAAKKMVDSARTKTNEAKAILNGLVNDLTAERDSLEAEVKQLQRVVESWQDEAAETASERDSLRAQVAEYERQIAAVGDLGVREQWPPDEWRAALARLDAPDDHLRAVERAAAAKALRSWVNEWPTTEGDGTFLADVKRDGLARADQIEGGTEPTDSEGHA